MEYFYVGIQQLLFYIIIFYNCSILIMNILHFQSNIYSKTIILWKIFVDSTYNLIILNNFEVTRFNFNK